MTEPYWEGLWHGILLVIALCCFLYIIMYLANRSRPRENQVNDLDKKHRWFTVALIITGICGGFAIGILMLSLLWGVN